MHELIQVNNGLYWTHTHTHTYIYIYWNNDIFIILE